MKLSTPCIQHLIERAAMAENEDWRDLADDAAAELRELRDIVMDRDERHLMQLREAGDELVGQITRLRPEIEALPRDTPLPDDLAREAFNPIRQLRRLDNEAAKTKLAEYVAFRYELRAATAWLEFADMPCLSPMARGTVVDDRLDPPAVVDCLVDHHSPYRVYEDAITAARGLLVEQIRDPEGEANIEYTRGIAELIADTFGYRGASDIGEARQRICADLGLPPTTLT